MSDLLLYKDKELTTPFIIEDIGDVEAGDTKLVDGYLANRTDFDIVQIEYEVFDKDVEILRVPKMIEFRTSHLITIKYTPSELRQTPLDTYITFYGKKRIPPE